MIKNWPNIKPIIGANTAITELIDADAWDPKAWSVAGYSAGGLDLSDDSANFIVAGVLPGDKLYIMDTTPSHTKSSLTVVTVHSTTVIETSPPGPIAGTAILYKVGKKQQHTLTTIASIIDARGIDAYSILYATLWTPADFTKFGRDQFGDVYCIF